MVIIGTQVKFDSLLRLLEEFFANWLDPRTQHMVGLLSCF